jgi:periplasmic mercuric ion binding protein
MKNETGTMFRAGTAMTGRRVASKRLAALIALSAALSVPAWAAQQSVWLAVPGMTCSACPITVKMALSRVDGVETVEVSYEERIASVTFDDTKTRVEALTEATANAGYPSRVMQ